MDYELLEIDGRPCVKTVEGIIDDQFAPAINEVLKPFLPFPAWMDSAIRRSIMDDLTVLAHQFRKREISATLTGDKIIRFRLVRRDDFREAARRTFDRYVVLHNKEKMSDGKKSVVVTPEMVQAGEAALEDLWNVWDYGLPPGTSANWVEAIYTAMELQRLSKLITSSQR